MLYAHATRNTLPALPARWERLALFALLAALMVLAGCASNQRVANSELTPEHPTDRHPGQPEQRNTTDDGMPLLTLDEANDVTLYAVSLVGTPYQRGGNTPDTGFDCSGLIAHVYRERASLITPRTVAALSQWGNALAPQDLRTGDLVLFKSRGLATHAGIYVGEDRFVHAPSSGGVVRLDSLKSAYWSRQEVSFRRP